MLHSCSDDGEKFTGRTTFRSVGFVEVVARRVMPVGLRSWSSGMSVSSMMQSALCEDDKDDRQRQHFPAKNS